MRRDPQPSRTSPAAAPGSRDPAAIEQHELSNLLSLITSFSQLLREGSAGPLTEQQAEYLDHIIECATSMNRMMKRAGRPAAPAGWNKPPP